jgi:hypothetical protein
MTMWIGACENGLQTPAIFTRHPKRELHEVHYARCVGALEDKIVQAAVVAILTPIYEAEFLGFSYGFRPGRGQHDALDALAYGINARDPIVSARARIGLRPRWCSALSRQ